MSNQFVEWLDEQEKLSKLSDYEIAKRGKFSHSAMSRARSGLAPGYDICIRIASVLNISPITVLRKAGLLPDAPDDQIRLEDWQYLLDQLPPSEREEIREIALMKIERRQKAEEAIRSSNLKPGKQIP